MAATFIQRASSADGGAAWGFSSIGAGVHQEETLIVIDWMTVNMTSTAGGNVDFQLVDNTDVSTGDTLSGIVWQATITLAATDTDTVHAVFPGGLPLRTSYQKTGSSLVQRNGLTEAPPNRTNITFASTADTWSVFVGYHFERMANRR